MRRETGADAFLQFREFLPVQVLQLRRIDVDDRRAAADHDAVELVEILLADRVELVVVTART